MHLDATDVTKESVSQCINTQAAKLEVTDDNDLHKVKMSPPESAGAPQNVNAYIYVDNANMLKKIEIPFSLDTMKVGDIEVVNGEASPITSEAFSVPEVFEGMSPGATFPNMIDALPESPETLVIQALLECVGFQFKKAPTTVTV